MLSLLDACLSKGHLLPLLSLELEVPAQGGSFKSLLALYENSLRRLSWPMGKIPLLFEQWKTLTSFNKYRYIFQLQIFKH